VKDLPQKKSLIYWPYPRAVVADDGPKKATPTTQPQARHRPNVLPSLDLKFSKVHPKAGLSEMRNIEDHCSKSKRGVLKAGRDQRTLECVALRAGDQILFLSSASSSDKKRRPTIIIPATGALAQSTGKVSERLSCSTVMDPSDHEVNSSGVVNLRDEVCLRRKNSASTM
jgi:hypothetical protein